MITDEERAGHALRVREPKLAEAVVAEQYRLQPDLLQRYGPDGRRHCVRDVSRHLRALATSVELGKTDRFVNYVRWARRVMSAHGIPAADFHVSLQALHKLMPTLLPSEPAEAACRHLDAALAAWDQHEPAEVGDLT